MSDTRGFRALAGYIFGGNEKEGSIAMTGPVVMKENNTKIAMTGPVTMSGGDSTMSMSFIMPSQYESISDLPKPNNDNVKIIEVEPKKVRM